MDISSSKEKDELRADFSAIQFMTDINKALSKYGIGFVYDKEQTDMMGRVGVTGFKRAYLLKDVMRGGGAGSESLGFLQYIETSGELSISMTSITDRFRGDAKPHIVVNDVVKGLLSDKDFEDFQRKLKIDRVQRGQEFILKVKEISIRVAGGDLGFTLEIKRDK